MGNMFGKEKPLKEVLRENKRMITRAIRELDREKMALEREEKRLTIEIKSAAKQQRMSTVKIMAKVNEESEPGLTESNTIICSTERSKEETNTSHYTTGSGSHATVYYEIY